MRTEANRVFDEFNRRYWRGRLPKYRVIRRAQVLGRALGRCYNLTQTILLRKDLSDEDVRLTLLHEMCHIGPDVRGDVHGPRFRRKLHRLVRLGEPKMLEDIERYDGTATEREIARLKAEGKLGGPEIPWRSDVWSHLDAFALERPFLRWATVRRVLAGEYRMTPAHFQRRAPWAEREWRQLSGDYRAIRRGDKAFRAKFLPLDKEAKP